MKFTLFVGTLLIFLPIFILLECLIQSYDCSLKNVIVPLNKSTMSKYFFGHSMKRYFLLDPNFIQLNHGSYGSYPKIVQQSLHNFQEQAERNPDRWVRRDAQKEMSKIRQLLAKYMNVQNPDDLVLVPNASSGLNAVLRSIAFRAGDDILYLSTGFIGMTAILKHIYDQNHGKVSLLEFPLNYPISNEQLLINFEQFLSRNSDRKIRIAVIDHISSQPGVVLPLERFLRLLQKRNIPVLVDGAHAIGQVEIDIGTLRPDYYVTDCHKWLYTPRGSAVLYMAPKHQTQIHPPVISFHYQTPSNIQQEFYFVGTTDYTNYMTIPTALQFRDQLGESNIRNYNHDLALEGGIVLAQKFGTRVLQEPNQVGNMIDVELPLTNHSLSFLSEDFWIDELLDNYKVFGIPHKHNGKWWLRVSAQIYNELSDFETLGNVFKKICKQLN